MSWKSKGCEKKEKITLREEKALYGKALTSDHNTSLQAHHQGTVPTLQGPVQPRSHSGKCRLMLFLQSCHWTHTPGNVLDIYHRRCVQGCNAVHQEEKKWDTEVSLEREIDGNTVLFPSEGINAAVTKTELALYVSPLITLQNHVDL